VTFGQFRLIDLGDLLWNVEGELMCPNNQVGTVDLFMVTHHGLAQSNADPLVLGVRPRAAVMQNGTRKGGAVAVFETLRKSPGLEDIWQLHWSYAGGIEHNAPGVFIANVDDAATIASVLTAPPGGGRGGGGGRGPGGPGAPAQPAGAPAAQPVGPAPATPPAQTAVPGETPATAGSPVPGPAPVGAPTPGAPGTAPGTGGPGAGPGGGRGAAAAAAAHSPAHYIKISAMADGSFTITNTRNGFTKTYAKRSN
jgi:hypothetical protein